VSIIAMSEEKIKTEGQSVIPPELICPGTKKIFLFPVRGRGNIIYEKQFAERLAEIDRNFFWRLDREKPLQRDEETEEKVKEFLAKNPAMKEMQYKYHVSREEKKIVHKKVHHHHHKDRVGFRPT
jgi:hypothetical protein